MKLHMPSERFNAPGNGFDLFALEETGPPCPELDTHTTYANGMQVFQFESPTSECITAMERVFSPISPWKKSRGSLLVP